MAHCEANVTYLDERDIFYNVRLREDFDFPHQPAAEKFQLCSGISRTDGRINSCEVAVKRPKKQESEAFVISLSQCEGILYNHFKRKH